MSLEQNEIVSMQTGWTFLNRYLRGILFRYLSSESMNLYVRPVDIISVGPITSGVYEQHAIDLFKRCAELGYDDFFVDIGANIGLTSYSVAPYFTRLYAFEPNPLAFKLLEVNLACSEYLDKFKIYNVGIGSRDEVLPLVVPKKNWGGAFLDSNENSYGENVLLEKDCFSVMDSQNYFRMNVDVREGAPVLRKIFAELNRSGGASGLIKIDVEGFEFSVVAQIARAIPSNVNAYILFENWEPSLDIHEFVKPFDGRATLFRFGWKRGARATGSKFLQRARFLAGLPFGISKMAYKLEAIDPSQRSVTGDIVMHVTSTPGA